MKPTIVFCGSHEARKIASNDALMMDGRDSAVVGYLTEEHRVAYGYDQLVSNLCDDPSDIQQTILAEEWIQYNIIRALPYFGKHAPIIILYDNKKPEEWSIYYDSNNEE